MAEKTCCVTGHRDIPEDRIAYVEQELRREVLAAIQDGYTRFISGFAEGADLMFAAIVVEQKKHNPDLFLEAAIPYAGRLKTKNKQFHELLRACDGIKIVCQEYAHSCFLERNRYMAGETTGCIAMFVLAFLVSPFGLPALGGWLVERLHGVKYAAMDFMAS